MGWDEMGWDDRLNRQPGIGSQDRADLICYSSAGSAVCTVLCDGKTGWDDEREMQTSEDRSSHTILHPGS